MDNLIQSPLPNRPLQEAPGAKTARICGICAIVAAVTCIGFPAAIALGIVALVQQAKAKRLAQEFPQDYQMPTSSGLALGIVGLVLPIFMLPFLGIVSAIAVPALLAQRSRAISKALSANLSSEMEQLTEQYRKGREVGLDASAIHASLEKCLQESHDANPLNKQGPAFRYVISVVSAQSPEEAQQQAEAEATTDGEIVFVVSYPEGSQQSGFIAGAAKMRAPIDGSGTVSQARSLD